MTFMRLIAVGCFGLSVGCGAGGDGSAGGSTTSTSESTSSGEATTDAMASSSGTGGVTGGPLACQPMPASIPLAEFSKTFASAICAQKEACGCAGGFACEGTFVMQIDAVIAGAEDAGIPYDGECAARVLHNTVTARGCGLKSEYSPLPCERCTIFQGSVPEGAACSPNDVVEFVRPCAEGTCSAMVCAPPPTALDVGDACFGPDGLLGYCPEGTVCDYNVSNTCVMTVPPGSDCADARCDLGTFCNASKVCEEPRPAGEPCASPVECASLYCPGGQGVCEDYVVICELEKIEDLLFGPSLFD